MLRDSRLIIKRLRSEGFELVSVRGSLDAALGEAREALAFAAEDWPELSGAAFPPRSLDALRQDPKFCEIAADAVVAAIPLHADLVRAA